MTPAHAKLPLLAPSFRRHASPGSALNLTRKQVNKLMTRLRDNHMGSGPNRVSHDGTRWLIKPPLNYSVSASLPHNTTLIDRRAVVRMEQARNEGQLLKAAVSMMRVPKFRIRCCSNIISLRLTDLVDGGVFDVGEHWFQSKTKESLSTRSLINL